MTNIEQMKADILGGKIKPSEGGKSGPRVPAGDFDVVVESASFGGGFKNPQSMRGVVEFKVTKVHSFLTKQATQTLLLVALLSATTRQRI